MPSSALRCRWHGDYLSNFFIRKYQKEDKEKVIKLYKNIITHDQDVVFWWPDPQGDADDVYCVFVDQELIAKGQIQIINMVPPNQPSESSHSIFINIKVNPKWNQHTEIKDMLFMKLYDRAIRLKQTLSSDYKTMLCEGNYATERDNNYFEEKGFFYLNSLYWMNCDLKDSLEPPLLGEDTIAVRLWKMEAEEEEQHYLNADLEIWPSNPLGIIKLRQYKSNPLWTAITAFTNGDEIVGSLMAWQEGSSPIGMIEEVFVKEAWRKKGIAKYLLLRGRHYLQEQGMQEATLEVFADSSSALSLYESVGFKVAKEEKRFAMELS
jgi:GNAT superfamily N-acetyltransferase